MKGLTQEQLADLAGTSFSYLGKIERGCSLATLLSDSVFKDVEMTEPVLEAAAILLRFIFPTEQKKLPV
ncbi:helix-turn-helix domain-containing protein [Brevibacillus sp. B_LB10_24]|uniref:helix-turn-helix domain-containing protein n=1 Tax=Brevibacillus sp. B_LB10_24 TaxID=3380645 RepID=UPI0038BCEAE8